MKDEVDAAARRYLADQIRLREEQRTAILLWGADAYGPGGPYPEAFTAEAVRLAAPADTGNVNRHRRRRNAAKARH